MRIVRARGLDDIARQIHLALRNAAVGIERVAHQAHDLHAFRRHVRVQLAQIGHFLQAGGAIGRPHIDHREPVVCKQGLIHGVAIDIRGGEQAQERRVFPRGGNGFVRPVCKAAQVVYCAIAHLAKRLRRLGALLAAAAIDKQLLLCAGKRRGRGLRQLAEGHVYGCGNVRLVVFCLRAHVDKQAVLPGVVALHGLLRRDGRGNGSLRRLRQGGKVYAQAEREQGREKCGFLFHGLDPPSWIRKAKSLQGNHTKCRAACQWFFVMKSPSAAAGQAKKQGAPLWRLAARHKGAKEKRRGYIYPFTEPSITPLTKNFCTNGYRIIMGAEAITIMEYFTSSARCSAAAWASTSL